MSQTSQTLALMPSKLCSVCDGMFKGTHPKHQEGRPHLSHGRLLAAAELGCYICRTIANSNDWASIYASQHDASFKYDIMYNGIGWFESLCITEDVREPKAVWEFRVLQYPGHSSSYKPPENPQGRALMKLARKWLKKCKRYHWLCRQADPKFRPTRLIQIVDSKRARLVIPAETRTGQYVAFSHCWGNKKTLKLCTDNLEQLRRGILVQNLPKSYQEAISMCLSLDLHFIWIDSLCIIQDSNEDWQREALAMKSVYGNAMLNLCAAAAADNSEESLTAREHTLLRPLQVKTAWDGKENDNSFLIYDDMFRDDIIDSPLRKRAWVFQEWYLSPRSLVLARHQLWWQCRQKLACESLPKGYQADEDERPDLQHDWMKDDRGQIGVGQDLFASWAQRIKWYAATRLTEESDRIIAFAGIAQAFGSSHRVAQEYLAGLWRGHLPAALCWYVVDSKTSRSSRYKAPSWTWASVDGPFQMSGGPGYAAKDKKYKEFCASVEDTRLIHVDERHITGLVKGGSINMRGHLCGPEKPNDLSGKMPGYGEFWINPIRIMFDEGEESGPLVSYLDNLDPEGCLKGLNEGASRRTESLKDAQGSIFYFPIGVEHRGRSVGMLGLVLYQPTHQTGVFHRIGLFLSSKFSADSDYKQLLELACPETTVLIL